MYKLKTHIIAKVSYNLDARTPEEMQGCNIGN